MGSRWCAAALAWVVCGALMAQAPVVPTDHYGPPACAGIKKAEYHDRVGRAQAEQQEGARDAYALTSAEPLENFDIVRYRMEDYYDCAGTGGCYWADLDAQYRRAEAALTLELGTRKPGEKLALVLDIDETSLSSYCIEQRENYGYIKAMFNAWVVTPEAATAIPGGLRLFNEARAAGVDVFFITGRPGIPDYAAATHDEDQTAPTARNLEAAGYHGWAGLQLRNGSENAATTIEYKSSERQRIKDRGYRIIMSVGDQWSDLQGEPKADVSVKLPNPFYFLP
jgi:hypothetical protein